MQNVINFPVPVVASFVVGQKYSMRSACDHNAVWVFEVISRTAKRMVIQSRNTVQDEKTTDLLRMSLKIVDGKEICFPLGRYSMAPVLKAS